MNFPVPPSGGSLGIGNPPSRSYLLSITASVPPSGGSLGIGNCPPNLGCRLHASPCSPFGGIPRNWKQPLQPCSSTIQYGCSPFGGIPRNWKLGVLLQVEPVRQWHPGSPFGGIPRNWKQNERNPQSLSTSEVPPSGGSLGIGNLNMDLLLVLEFAVPPSGGSLGIGNIKQSRKNFRLLLCSPFGGIPRNWKPLFGALWPSQLRMFPLRGDP